MRLGYVIAYVPDVYAALDFYQTAFGFQRQFLDEAGRYGELDTGAVPLGFASLTQAASNGVTVAPIPPQTTAAVEIAFVVEDVAAAFATAVAAGATSVAAPHGQTLGPDRGVFARSLWPAGRTLLAHARLTKLSLDPTRRDQTTV